MNGPVQNIAIRRVGAMGSLPALAELPRLASTQGRTSRPWHPRRRPRRGVAIVFVLALIAITMALSYSLLRTQVTATQIQANSNQRALARQAAMTGLSAALRQIQLQAWIDDGGVSSTLSGRISADETYHVTFSTGDATLTDTHPDYEDYPYRVTVLSTGYALDPATAGTVCSHQVQAVMRLVPRKLADEPSSWTQMQQYTLFQYKPASTGGGYHVVIEAACRIEGRVRIQSELKLDIMAPAGSNARARYLSDLNQMRVDGLGDERPFTGPIDLDTSKLAAATLDLLTTSLSIATSHKAQLTTADWTHPGAVTSYQLYSGGKTYAVPRVGLDHTDTVFEPHPITNPLGVFLRIGDLNLNDNVTVRGTMILSDSGGDLNILGNNVRFESVALHPLDGSDIPIRLPVAIVANDFAVRAGSKGVVDGMVVAFDEFWVKRDDQANIDFHLTGRLINKRFHVEQRNDWDLGGSWWSNRYDDFMDQLDGGEPYMPVWLEENFDLDSTPRLTFKPGSTPASYHWYNPDQPIYVPHPDDGGLRWELVSWTDSP